MKPKTMFILIAVLAVLAGAVYMQYAGRGQQADAGRDAGEKVLPGLDVNAIEQIDLRAGGEQLTLKRSDDMWVAVSLYDYPVDFVELSEAVLALAELEIGQVVYDGEEFAAEYGLAPGGETNLPMSVSLKDGQGDDLAVLHLGAYRERESEGPYGGGAFPDGRYVRADGGPVALVDDTLDAFSLDAMDWIDKELLDVSSDALDIVTVTRSNETYSVTKKGSDYLVSNLRTNEEVDSASAGRVCRALQYFNCSEIIDPDRSDEELGFDRACTYEFKSTDGFTYTVKTAESPKLEDTYYVRIQVQYEPPPEPKPEDFIDASDTNAPAADAENPAYEKALKAYNDEVKEAEKRFGRLKRTLSGWTYGISMYNAQSLCMPRSELVSVKEPEEEPEEPEEANE